MTMVHLDLGGAHGVHAHGLFVSPRCSDTRSRIDAIGSLEGATPCYMMLRLTCHTVGSKVSSDDLRFVDTAFTKLWTHWLIWWPPKAGKNRLGIVWSSGRKGHLWERSATHEVSVTWIFWIEQDLLGDQGWHGRLRGVLKDERPGQESHPTTKK